MSRLADIVLGIAVTCVAVPVVLLVSTILMQLPKP